MYCKIPSQIKIAGQNFDIKFKNRLEEDKLGTCCVAESSIEIAETFMGRKQSLASQVNTFYHEMIHAILDNMGENSLSGNERFVSCFSGFLTEAMGNAVFIEENNSTDK